MQQQSTNKTSLQDQLFG
uniref:Uncharacterized protein n=1 Tax=Anguilla anguilla TaxID=7936 RepID=A0A0E9V1X5_ANGAN